MQLTLAATQKLPPTVRMAVNVYSILFYPALACPIRSVTDDNTSFILSCIMSTAFFVFGPMLQHKHSSKQAVS